MCPFKAAWRLRGYSIRERLLLLVCDLFVRLALFGPLCLRAETHLTTSTSLWSSRGFFGRATLSPCHSLICTVTFVGLLSGAPLSTTKPDDEERTVIFTRASLYELPLWCSAWWCVRVNEEISTWTRHGKLQFNFERFNNERFPSVHEGCS